MAGETRRRDKGLTRLNYSGRLKEAAAIDNQEDESCKLSSEQEELQKKLSNRKYVKSKIHEALEMLNDERKRKQVNLTDSDAHYMKSGGSKDVRPGYNCQAVSTEDGIIVTADAVTEANDHDQLEPMIEQTELNTGKKVEEVSADSGYGGYASCEYLEKKRWICAGYVFSPIQIRRIQEGGEPLSLQ